MVCKYFVTYFFQPKLADLFVWASLVMGHRSVYELVVKEVELFAPFIIPDRPRFEEFILLRGAFDAGSFKDFDQVSTADFAHCHENLKREEHLSIFRFVHHAQSSAARGDDQFSNLVVYEHVELFGHVVFKPVVLFGDRPLPSLKILPL